MCSRCLRLVLAMLFAARTLPSRAAARCSSAYEIVARIRSLLLRTVRCGPERSLALTSYTGWSAAYSPARSPSRNIPMSWWLRKLSTG